MKVYLIVLLVFLNACSLTTKPPANKHDFGISSVSANSKTDVSVTTPDWLYNTCIHYRLLHVSATELRCYNLDQWLAPPADLLKQQLSYHLSSKHRLVVELNEFEQQFDNANTARVVMKLNLAVYDKTEHLLANQQFQFSQPTAANAAGAVSGFSSLIQKAIMTMQTWLDHLD